MVSFPSKCKTAQSTIHLDAMCYLCPRSSERVKFRLWYPISNPTPVSDPDINIIHVISPISILVILGMEVYEMEITHTHTQTRACPPALYTHAETHGSV
jgi:hypothetical protein